MVPSPNDLYIFVSQPAYCYYQRVNDPEAERQCGANLNRFHGLLLAYEKRHGALPNAAFFPNHAAAPDSLPVLLGGPASEHLVCPTSGPDFQRLGFNYLWNVKCSGKKLSEISDPANTWLMMDFTGCHDYMIHIQSCGHRGGVMTLYADGTVKWAVPPDRKAWREWGGW